MDESKRNIERKTDREERILFSIKKENENGKKAVNIVQGRRWNCWKGGKPKLCDGAGVTNLYPLVSVAHHGNEEINQNNHSDYLIDTKRDNKHFLCPLWLAELKLGDGCRGGRQVGCHLFERTYWYKCCGCQ